MAQKKRKRFILLILGQLITSYYQNGKNGNQINYTADIPYKTRFQSKSFGTYMIKTDDIYCN